jgi:carboxypeptidase Q
MIEMASDQVRCDLEVLTRDIGVRLAGSPGEHEAAAYVAAECRRAGALVSIEEFAVRERAVIAETLDVRIGGEWRRFPCSLLSNTPGTEGRAVEAPMALIDAATGYQRGDLGFLTGKAVVHLGSHIEDADHYRRLLEARPAFLLFVDVRYPGSVATSDGMFPAYVHHFGAVPTASVAYQDAWSWQVGGADAARLQVDGGMRPGRSQNVVAELPGSDPAAGVIYVGAHHDTQAASVGADDNGTGVAAILGLTRALALSPRRRTIRLVSFGAEEQLSVGSASYVRRHRQELAASGRLMFNFDSFGSHLGWTYLVCNGDTGIAPVFVAALAERQQYVKVVDDLIPYADHFPFVAAGVPAAWVGRDNCTAGRFFHHRPDDDLTRVSCPLVATIASAVGAALESLGNLETWPFAAGHDEARRTAAAKTWQDLFGGWEGWA